MSHYRECRIFEYSNNLRSRIYLDIRLCQKKLRMSHSGTNPTSGLNKNFSKMEILQQSSVTANLPKDTHKYQCRVKKCYNVQIRYEIRSEIIRFTRSTSITTSVKMLNSHSLLCLVFSTFVQLFSNFFLTFSQLFFFKFVAIFCQFLSICVSFFYFFVTLFP